MDKAIDITYGTSGVSPSGDQQLLRLNNEVIECQACPRLVQFRESVAEVKKETVLRMELLAAASPGIR